MEELGDGENLEKIGGCPVVEVEGSAEDFAVLLSAMDDGFGLLSGDTTFWTLAAILRASTLYDFTSMRAWAVKTLEAMWPNTLGSISPMKKLFAAETLELARVCDVPSVRKRVLYELVRRGVFGLPGVEDGGEEYNEDDKLVSYGDLRTLISAREHLAQEWVILASCAPAPLCNSEAHYDDARIWDKVVHKKGIFEERMYDPLVGLGVLANLRFQDSPYPEGAEVGVLAVGWKKTNWCAYCHPLMTKSFLHARAKIWGKLDIWFGIA